MCVVHWQYCSIRTHFASTLLICTSNCQSTLSLARASASDHEHLGDEVSSPAGQPEAVAEPPDSIPTYPDHSIPAGEASEQQGRANGLAGWTTYTQLICMPTAPQVIPAVQLYTELSDALVAWGGLKLVTEALTFFATHAQCNGKKKEVSHASSGTATAVNLCRGEQAQPHAVSEWFGIFTQQRARGVAHRSNAASSTTQCRYTRSHTVGCLQTRRPGANGTPKPVLAFSHAEVRGSDLRQADSSHQRQPKEEDQGTALSRTRSEAGQTQPEEHEVVLASKGVWALDSKAAALLEHITDSTQQASASISTPLQVGPQPQHAGMQSIMCWPEVKSAKAFHSMSRHQCGTNLPSPEIHTWPSWDSLHVQCRMKSMCRA